MISYLIGIDYRTVPLEVMEEALRLRHKIIDYWQSVNPGKVAVLTTCNRVEIYGVASTQKEAITLQRDFRHIFKKYFKNDYTAYGDYNIYKVFRRT